MKEFTVNVVTAFGRGETLALSLLAEGFSVRVLDFTSAFPSEYHRGPGPFPLQMQAERPATQEWLSELEPLSRGLAFWLAEGPLELSGPNAAAFLAARQDLQSLKSGRSASDFKTDWLRRFLRKWASPVHSESWENREAWQNSDARSGSEGAVFPWDSPLGLFPSYEEATVLTLKKWREVGPAPLLCEGFKDVQFTGSRLTEMAIVAGQDVAFRADQWIWCLSSRESEILNAEVASRLFPKGIWRPDWSWIRLSAQCEHGPWVEGFPSQTLVIGDICLPWCYANFAVLRKLDPEGFQVWLKVPAKAVADEAQRLAWSQELEGLLNQRLSLAKWRVESSPWTVCPHSLVFEAEKCDIGVSPWKNWDWIAPETLPRLDFSARLARENHSFQRLIQWRNDQLKKQGAPRDHAIHAP